MDDPVSQALGNLQNVLEVAGAIAFATSGVLAAGRARMDWVGAVVLGIAAALGGGTMRDLLLGELPVFWIKDTWFVIVAAVSALAVIPLSRTSVRKYSDRYDFLNIADAAGLSMFVITGANVAITAGANDYVAVLMGVITGIGGGIVRDSLASKIPDILREGKLYASAALAGAAIYVGLLHLPVDTRLTLWLPIGLIFGLRMLAIFRGWALPTFEPHGGTETKERD